MGPGAGAAAVTQPPGEGTGRERGVRAPAVTWAQPGAWTVRVHGAGPAELLAVARDAGPPGDGPSGAPPDVRVRFVGALGSDGPLTLLDGDRFATDGRHLLVLDRSRRPVARLAERGHALEIVCRSGVPRVPFLGVALDLVGLRRGWAPLHASAWSTPDGRGVLVSGWPGSGKTGALLAACLGGARPIGDDRLLLAAGDGAEGAVVAGTGRPVVVKAWHLAWLGPVAGAERSLLDRAEPAVSALARLVPGEGLAARVIAGVLRRIRERPRRELALHEMARLARLGKEPPPSHEPRPRLRPDVVVLLETRERSGMHAEPLDPSLAASRLAAHAARDLLPAHQVALAFRYVTGRPAWFLDPGSAATHIEGVALRALRDVPAWTVRHPHRCPPAALHDLVVRLAERSDPSIRPQSIRPRSHP